MLHTFIINPTSGKKDSSEYIINYLKDNYPNLNYQIHITTSHGDALVYTREVCENKKPEEEVTFYACGGDGTLNEVVNGAYGYDNVYIASYPCGTGNDFVKVFGINHHFKQIDKIINGTPKKIDLLKVNNRLTCNICNLGFDACAGYNMIKYRRWALVSGKGAYILGVIKSLIVDMNFNCEIEVDGQKSKYQNILLTAIGNGVCYGGGFYCLPKAKIDDGLIDVVIVKKVSRLTFLRLIHNYKTGKYVDMEKYNKVLEYKKCKNYKLKCEKGIAICFDGEIEKVNEINIEVLPKAINFIVPDGYTC